jgi:hypothetical protein
VVFIATNHLVAVGEGCWRWAHRTVRCATGHCPVRRHATQPLGLGAGRPLEALSSCGTRQCDAALDRYCSLSGAPLTLRSNSVAHCSSRQVLLQSIVVRSSHCSAGTPDSPVIFSRVRPLKPESGLLDYVWWHTGQSGAPDQSTLGFFAPLNLIPNFNFYWFVLNLYASVESII